MSARNWSEATAHCGSAGEMLQLELLQQPYLFKLRQTAGVKQFIKRQWTRQTWSDMGQGWQGCEDDLRLSGWSSKRRVIVMRRQLKMNALLERKNNNNGKDKNAQVELHFIDENQPVKLGICGAGKQRGLLVGANRATLP